MEPAGPNPNPLLAEDPLAWERLIEATNPAAMLVRIHGRMSALLRRRMTADDIWQETLLQAWRSRERHQWSGTRAFRHWLLEIAENRMRDSVDRERTQKRGGGDGVASLPRIAHPSGPAASTSGLPAGSSTPSRAILHRERAELMRSALESVPDALREVVRRRLFEEQGLDQIAAALELSHAAVKHRLRKGAAAYRERLVLLLGSHPGSSGWNP